MYMKSRFVNFIRHGRREEGQAMLLAAVSMVVILGFAAFAVDIGYVAVQKTDLQNAADAAALAGVADLPSSANAIGTAVVYAQANGMDIIENNKTNNRDKVVITPLSATQLQVVCTREVDYFFAGVLGFESTTVTAKAVAEQDQTQWNGDALPFLNVNMAYANGTKLKVRDKDWGGAFDSIDKVDRGDKLPGAYWAFDIKYEDGLIDKNGKDNSIQKSVEEIYNAGVASGNKTVYLFSLSNEVRVSNKVKVILSDGSVTTKAPTALGTNDVIHPSQLVLLRVTFDYCGKNSLDVDFTVTGMYDLGNDFKDGSGNNLPDYPTDYVSPSGDSDGVHLIE